MPDMNEAPALDTRAALLVKANGYATSEPGFARFLRVIVDATDPEDLAARSADALEHAFRASYGRLGRRDNAGHDVYARPADRPGEPDIVEVFSADMPFIVDSVLAAIRATGGTVRLISHPIVPFDPTTYRVLDMRQPGSRLESFLHVEIDPLDDLRRSEQMHREIDETLTEVSRAVAGWRPMLERVKQVIADWHSNPPKGVAAAPLAEGIHFLDWLGEHNFTFLGLREYRVEAGELLPVEGRGLGILADPAVLFLRSGVAFVEMTEQHRAFLADPAPLLVSKANLRSRVHRRAYMDYVGIKLYDAEGAVTGELRILGLFTSMSLATPSIEVPLVRKKLGDVLKRAGHDPQGHAGKALLAALESFPRDELFQIDEPLLFEFATIISSLVDRPRVRVLSRADRFGNFVSLLVFVPRDRYDTEARIKIGDFLARAHDGHVSAFFPSFPEGELVRVHFIIGREGGEAPQPSPQDLEDGVTDAILTFADRLVLAAGNRAAIAGYLDAFPGDYQAVHGAAAALEDIGIFQMLPDERGIALKLGENAGRAGSLGLKVYHRGAPIPLSARVPMLENFGFTVIDEDTFTVTAENAAPAWLHDMLLETDVALDPDNREDGQRIERAILAVWRREAESDGLNRLTLTARLGWEDVEILRALTGYLRQAAIPYSRDYLNTVLTRNAGAAAALVQLFHAANDPHFATDRTAAITAAHDVITAAVAATPSLDEDRILRRYLNLVEAVVRTNAYQRDQDGGRRPALALKFDCTIIDGLPAPKPYREIYVYSPRVEGLHLRFGPIARGGLRWSDRPEDFRTEVLGLVKAQQVKNAIIVPVGAKGAFVPKQTPADADRETVLREGTACYRIFISTLLDVTDSIAGDTVLPPPDVLRHDGDDPYLVVAADKGTASFSDTANAIAVDREFWLGDAFASGGSSGYDHKKMGITARGAWEGVKRHFREMDRDIQTSPFTVVGVGDMSGDVFGNGMLLSSELRLVAAFDHRDIFIDPSPDPAASLAERKRLFELPRSSWQDYNADVLSPGGGVFSRALKDVPLSAEAQAVLGLDDSPLTPADVMRAILKAQVDLLWFGGIGTYVKGAGESNADAGDKANDALRINGAEIRALVVGEGANLGVTQLGRVEYAQRGGGINTDAIDNSAGVNSSDLEVNIKIAFGPLLQSGELSRDARDAFLVGMTDEVAELCLRNNYLQTLALSVEEARGPGALVEHQGLLEALEATGGLDRAVEFLPSDAQLRQRLQAGQGFTRPELAVLLAYAKNSANAALLATGLPDDPYLGKELYRYFPDKLVETYDQAVTRHRLRREIVATVLANAMINRGGPAFLAEMTAASGAHAGEIAAAYALARDVYATTTLNKDIDALDGVLAGKVQLQLYIEVQALLRRETLWFLRNGRLQQGLRELFDRYGAGIAEVRALLPQVADPWIAGLLGKRAAELQAAGVGVELAQQVAELPVLTFATDIVLVSELSGQPVEEAAHTFFGVLQAFSLGQVLEAAGRLAPTDRYDRLALDRALANLMRALRELTVDVLADGRGGVVWLLGRWHERQGEAIGRTAAAITDLTSADLTVSRLSVAAGLLADMVRAG